MFFVLFLMIFLVLLIAISIVNLFLSLAIKLVTNNSIEEYKIIIPSILYLIITCLTLFIIYVLSVNILGLSLKDSVMAIVFKTVDIAPKLKTIIVLDTIVIIISILIQSLCMLTVNIDYTVTFGKIRMLFKGIFNKIKSNKKSNENNNIENKENLSQNNNRSLVAVVPENEIAENKERQKLTMVSAIICTIFIFSFLSFVFMGLFTTGNILSTKIF